MLKVRTIQLFHHPHTELTKAYCSYLIMFKSTKSFLRNINLISRKQFTMDEVIYFSDSDITERYRLASIPKRDSNGRFTKRRKVYMPTPRLKFFLQQANSLLSAIYSPPPCSFAFIKGRTIVGNATPHTNKKYILSLDIKDFFNSISIQKAVSAIKSAFPWQFRGEFIQAIVGASSLNGHLVQGSPLSPTISNIVCLNLDKRISSYCESLKISFTRYADDFTFSSNDFDFKRDSSFLDNITKLISEEGFALNNEKTHIQLYNNKQVVTGLVVNSKVNVARRYIKEIRNILYIWKRFGYDEALESFRFHYLHISRKIGSSLRSRISYEDEKRILHSRMVKKATNYSPRLDQHILGRLNFLKMVRGENDYQYLQLTQKFNELSKKLPYKKDKDGSYSFKSIQHFEWALGCLVLTDDVKNENGTQFFKMNNGGKAIISTKLLSFLSSVEPEYYSVALSLIKSKCRVKAINLEANLFIIWATLLDLKKYRWAIIDAVYRAARDRYESIHCLAKVERSEIESLHKDFQFAMNNGNYAMIHAYLDICNFLNLDSGLYPENFDLLNSNDKSILLQKWGWNYYSLYIDTVPTDKDGVPLSESTFDNYRRQWGRNFAHLRWKGADGIALVAGTNKWVIEVTDRNLDEDDVMRELLSNKEIEVCIIRKPTLLLVVNKDVLQEKEYQGFTIHKSGYYPIYPYKGEPMEIKTIELS